MGTVTPTTRRTARLLPDLPPISIGALAVGLGRPVRRARTAWSCPGPCVINETDAGVQPACSPPDPDSARAHRVLGAAASAASWSAKATSATRIGTALHRHVCLTFDYYGVEVDAYTYIPVT